MRSDVDTLKGEVNEVKQDVKHILKLLAEQEGARKERERMEDHQIKKRDLSMGQLAAYATLVAALTGVMTAFAPVAVHIVFHTQ